MRLMTLTDRIVETGHHTLIVMRDTAQDRAVCQAVCVVDDALIGNVRSKLGLIETIASRKLEEGELAFDGRVWITPSDLPHPVSH